MPEQNWMPVRQFTKLLKEASKVVKAGNIERFNQINEELKPIGYSLLIRDGKVYVKQEGRE